MSDYGEEFVSYEGDLNLYSWQLSLLGGLAVGVAVTEAAPLFGASELVTDSIAVAAITVAFAGFRKLFKWMHRSES